MIFGNATRLKWSDPHAELRVQDLGNPTRAMAELKGLCLLESNFHTRLCGI